MKKRIAIGIVVMTLLLCGCSSEGSKATGDMAESKSSKSESQSARKEEKHEKNLIVRFLEILRLDLRKLILTPSLCVVE